MPTPNTLRYALAAAARDWWVFPLTPGDKVPLPGMSWKRLATADPAVIGRIWARRPYNIGIACGPSHLVVIDLDTPKPGEQPPERWRQPGVHSGADVFALLCEQAGQPVPWETFQVRTRRGGLHLYFTAPADGPQLGNTSGDQGNGLGWKIDTRAAGGLVVGPGSYVDLPDGTGSYQVLHAAAPAPLPGWLAQRLRPVPAPARPAAPVTRRSGSRGAYLDAAIAGCLDRIAASRTDGNRNTTLWGASVALGQLVAGGALDETTTEVQLLEAAVQTGLTPGEAARTIRSGFRRGAQRPRVVPA
ncbi:bifunctional DNA primase/polymerase [Nonomuraea endophytica]|uniref:DNA primase/polymerase bifunctional N-terminal domain-containing protein n=1 Tax=Nonomuraea endophytica TaxID=714136 RepID=A0A7W7ZWD7_9ACTN|nr:bifunctional DNA primase/polymerase [Nonomuraea endophytica]MBB5074556.1 hypothetical protein [Nonomuraea endophytica]